VKALERVLGIALFERQPSGLKLTEAGRITFEHTSVMFRAGERLAEALGHKTPVAPLVLKVGISGAVGRNTTTDFLMPLLKLPDCVPSIRAADTMELMRELRSGELDLVLCESEPPEAARRGLEVVLLERITLVGVAPPDLSPAPDWQDVALVNYRTSSAFRWEVETFLETRGLRPRIVAEADDALFLVEAAARGQHVAFVPRSVARDAIATGRLKQVAQLEAGHAGVHALYQDGATADLARRAVEVLLEHLRSNQLEM
jgi:LysR family transcriptional regulator, transcriptional activator of nhaA